MNNANSDLLARDTRQPMETVIVFCLDRQEPVDER